MIDLTRRTCWGMFVLSLATLMYELILTRIFAVIMWYHFASMAISLALFGISLAALLVYLKADWFPPDKTERQASLCGVAFALSVSFFFGLFVWFRLQPQVGFKILSFFHQTHFQPFQQGFNNVDLPVDMLLSLTLLYLLTALPFFCSGLGITLLLRRHLASIGRLYSWDLLGAGAGCLLIIPILKLVGGMTGLLAIGLVGLFAAWLLSPDRGRGIRVVPLIIGLVLLAAGIGNYLYDYAGVRFVRGRYEPNILWSGWNSFSRVAVYPVRGEGEEQAWGLSRRFRGSIPEQLGVVIDDTGYTTMYRWDDGENFDFFRHNVIALAYRIKQQPTGLVIGPGGGKDVLAALAGGASKVTALELNPLVAEAVNDRFGSFTGELYRRPGVELAVDEGRSWIRRQQRAWDVIQASAVFGRMPPSAGAFTLSENNLYTLEAFRDYWEHLSDDGILTISRFIYERESLRLVSLGLAFLREQGVTDPAAHIAVIKERGLANFMLKKSPFTAEEIAALRTMTADLAFQEVLLPDRRDGNDPFHRLVQSDGNPIFYDSIPFDVRPTSDDKPFFYYMFKPGDFLNLFFFPTEIPFSDRAILTLRNLLVVVTALVLVCLLLPLSLLRGRALLARGGWRRLLYFSCLGLGFMLLEIGMLRQFILFLGPPIYALAVILCALLVFSGFGSLLAARVPPGREKRWLLTVLLALVLLSQFYSYGLAMLLDSMLAAPILVRCFASVMLLVPLGLLLGFPLPLGMRLLHGDAAAVAWSWGVNGATSVFGALLAVVIAMNAGFTVTLLSGGAVYAVGALALLGWRSEN
ncbi:MAG: hypothetical protein C0616_07330 [Desulfuromonas sp.]|nr:MAG: hypothetical protein C0616_07330 [Desulfuromonas sp.]